MPTAEWYEEFARKTKLRTWKESERFTKLDKLDLLLVDKLSKLKPLLTQYETDPVAKYSLSEGDKQTISTLKKYAPSLFREIPKVELAIPESQKAETSYGEYKVLGEEAGVDIKQIEAEKDKRGFWKKLFATLTTPERTLGAFLTTAEKVDPQQRVYKLMLENFPGRPLPISELTYLKQQMLKGVSDKELIRFIASRKNELASIDSKKDLYISPGVTPPKPEQELRKAIGEAFLNRPGEFQDTGFTKYYKQDLTMPEAVASFWGLGSDIVLSPLSWTGLGNVFKPLNKLIGAKMAASALGQTVKVTKLGKSIDLMLKALSFKKSPITTLATKLRREEIYGMTKTVDLIETLIKKTSSIDDAIAITKNLADPDTFKLTPQLDDVAKTIKSLFSKFATEEAEKGILKNVLENYVPGRIPSELISKIPKGRKISALGKVTQPFQLPKTFKNILERAEFGIPTEQNIFRLTVKRASEHYKALSRLSMVDEVAKFGKKVIDLTPLEKINLVETGMKELKGLYYEPDIARVIKATNQFAILDEPTNALLHAYDKSLNLLKGYMTVVNPGFHFRNFYSNYWLLFLKDTMKAFDPVSHLNAIGIQLAKKNPERIINLGDDAAKILGKSAWSADELYELSGKLGVRRTGFIRSDVAEYLSQRIDFLLKPKAQRILSRFNPLSRENIPMKIGDIVGGFVEDNARLVGWVNDLKAGMSFEDAAINTKKFLIDYSDLSLFEKNVLKRIYPFYAWLRKNSVLQAEQLLKQPGKFALIPKLKKYIESFSEDVDDKYLPDYYEDLAAIRTPLKIGGKPLYLNPNFPWQDLSKLTSAKDWISAINPMLKIPAELALNREAYFGRDINVLGQLKLAPRYLQGLENILPLEKILPGAKKGKEGQLYLTGRQEYLSRQIPFLYNIHKVLPPEADAEAPVKNKYITDLLSTLGGIKLFSYDEEKNKMYYYDDLINRILAELKSKRTLGEYVPTMSEFKSALKKIYEGEIGKKYNIEELNKLKDLLKFTGSTKELDLFLQLVEKPYKEEMGKVTGADLLKLKRLLDEMGIKPSMEDINKVLSMR